MKRAQDQVIVGVATGAGPQGQAQAHATGMAQLQYIQLN